MLEKILLITLISLINPDTIDVYYLKAKNNTVIKNRKNALLCVQIEENLKKDKNFYILFESKEEHSTINKKIYYNYLEDTCEDMETYNISLDDLSDEFSYYEEKPNLQNADDGFHYEYKLNKKEDNFKYAFMLITNFTGKENFTVQYNSFCVDAVLIYVVVVVASLLGLIIIAIIIVCKCYVSKKAKQMAQYGKDGEESLVGDTNTAS